MRYLPVLILFFISLSVCGQGGDRDGITDGKQQERRQQQKQERRQERLIENVRTNRIPDALNRIKLIKTTYMVTKLGLTTEQAAKFGPLYNRYQEELFLIQRQIRLNNSPLANNGKDQVMNELALEDKRTAIKRNYANEFLKIMPPEKLSLIYKSEKEFNDEALKNLKENRKDANN